MLQRTSGGGKDAVGQSRTLRLPAAPFQKRNQNRWQITTPGYALAPRSSVPTAQKEGRNQEKGLKAHTTLCWLVGGCGDTQKVGCIVRGAVGRHCQKATTWPVLEKRLLQNAKHLRQWGMGTEHTTQPTSGEEMVAHKNGGCRRKNSIFNRKDLERESQTYEAPGLCRKNGWLKRLGGLVGGETDGLISM